MLKSDLFKLIRDIKDLSVDETPIIVGSQAIHGITDQPPDIAKRSVECDFLFASGNTEVRERINTQLGILTEYQDEYGFYADAVGLATVILPVGWEHRLNPFLDESGTAVAQCVDFHDVAVSKLVAGRPKDLEFLETAFASDLLSVKEFLDRVVLVRSRVENDVLKDRLSRLIRELESRRIHSDIVPEIREFIRHRED